MEGFDIFVGIGIAGLIVFSLLLTGGMILLIISIVKTVKGKKKIGGIVAGGIMTFAGLIMAFYSAMMLFLGGYAGAVATSSEATKMQYKITVAIKQRDEDELADLFASRSYSGDEIEPEDAEQLFTYLDGYVISSKTITGTAYHNDIKEVEYKYILNNEDGDKSTLFIYCITQANSSNKKYVGIQFIQLNQGKSVTEYGTKPKLN